MFYYFRLCRALPQPSMGQSLCKLAPFPGGRWHFCLLGRAVQPGRKQNSHVLCFQVSPVAGSGGWPCP